MSTADLAAPPPIKEEPEPTTPVKGPEEKAVQETAVSEKDAEVFPKSEEGGTYSLSRLFHVLSMCTPCAIHALLIIFWQASTKTSPQVSPG